MGEIGLNRLEYLYDISFWELLLISRGYHQRQRSLWSATRWQTFRLMECQIGSKEMQRLHWQSPSDLLPLPWDSKDKHEPITKEEREEMQELMRNIREEMQRSGK